MSLPLKRLGRRQLLGQTNGYVPINPEVTGWINMLYYFATASCDPNTAQAIDNFVTTLKGQNVWSQMVAVNVFAQSSLNTFAQNQVMMLLPLVSPVYISPITLPWQSSGGTPLISTSGYCPNGNFFINTFLPFPTTFPNSNSNGISVYQSSGSNSAGMLAGTSNGFTFLFYIQQATIGVANPLIGQTDILLSNDWNTPGFSSSTASPANVTTGFYSLSRTAATTASTYRGNSTGFFPGTGSSGSTSPSSNLTSNLTVFQLQSELDSLWYCPNTTISFVAFHQGLTQGQTQVLFNAVQTMRQQMGGGWV